MALVPSPPGSAPGLITVPLSRCPRRWHGHVPARSVYRTKSIPFSAVGDFATALTVTSSWQRPVSLAGNPEAVLWAPSCPGSVASWRMQEQQERARALPALPALPAAS